jgi:hypothetical protein
LRREELLALVAEGFHKPAWHGPNLRSALRGVRVEEAAWRPARGRHNIWEIAVHAAFWKYAVTRRLAGSRRHGFPENGRNWFARDGKKSAGGAMARRWKRDLALLATTHRELCQAIQNLKESDLTRATRGNRQTALRNVVGIAMHDVYHAGQIQLLRKLYAAQRGRY